MVSYKNTAYSFAFIALAMLMQPSYVFAQDDERNLEDLTIDLEINSAPVNSSDLDAAVNAPSDTILSDTVDQFETQADQQPLVEVPYSGQFYDSSAVPSSSGLRQDAAPVQVDPKYVPGSRYVIVRKDAASGSFSARLTAAQRANSLGRYSAALELYEQLYKESPKSKSILLGLAVAQQNTGFMQSAIGTYEELLNIDPDNIDAEVNMLGLIMQRYPAIAFQKLINLWERNSGNPSVAAQVGLTSAKLGNTEDAMRFLGIAVSLEPNNANHYYNLAVVTDRAGAYKDAIDFYQKALEVDAVYGGNRSVPRTSIYDRLAKLRRL